MDSRRKATPLMNKHSGHYKRDYYGGALVMLVGVIVALHSITYHVGTLTHMGPGFYPAALGVLLALTGLGIVLNAPFAETEDSSEGWPPEWRGWFCIMLGIVAFIIAGTYGGLVPATFLVVFISAMGDRDNTWKSAFVLALVVVAISIVVFWWALGLQLPLFR